MHLWRGEGCTLLMFSGCTGSNCHVQRGPPSCWCHCQHQTLPPGDPSCEMLWYFLCPLLTHLEFSSSSLCLYCAQFPVYFSDYQNILLCQLQHTVSIHSKLFCTWLKRISCAWHWDQGVQWLNPPVALHGSNQINLPLLLLKLLNWIFLFEGVLCHFFAFLSPTYLCSIWPSFTYSSPFPHPQSSQIYVLRSFQRGPNVISPFL